MLPNLIIIGAQKAGTSSLHRYLRLHPAVAMSRPKELNFFTSPEWNWGRGVRWYESHFTEDLPVRGEASPSYTTFPHETGIPERMRSVVPDARLVYLVRDPVDRLASQYVHNSSKGLERRSFAEVARDAGFDRSPYVTQGRYHMQLARYLDHFAPERVLVVDQFDLLRSRRRTLHRIFHFLGVDPGFWTADYAALSNTSGDRGRHAVLRARARQAARALAGPAASRLEARLAQPRRPWLNAGMRRWLGELFAEDAASLRELTGQEFRSWSV